MSRNPYILRHQTFHTTQVFADWMEAARRDGVATTEAEQIAALLTYASIGLQPPYRDAETLCRQLLAEDEAALRNAQLFVISPEMQRVTVAAALSVASTDVSTLKADDDLTCPVGLLVLAEPLILKTRDGGLSDLRAFSWTPADLVLSLEPEPVRGLRITDFMDRDGPVRARQYEAIRFEMQQRGYPLPLLIPDGHIGVRSDGLGATVSDEWRRTEEAIHRFRTARMTAVVPQERRELNQADLNVGEYDGGEIEDPTFDFGARFLFAFWRLCEQRIASVSRYSDEPGSGGKASRIADTRVVRLRHTSSTPDELRSPGAQRYKHRWVVRMHKVNQWYPSTQTHKILFRGPYVKGPKDAPMLRGETVTALVR